MVARRPPPAPRVRRRARRAGVRTPAAASGAASDAPAPAAPAASPRAALEEVRGRIDAVDEQLHRLLNERARLAQRVGISKSHDGRTVDFYRPEREAQVLRQARAQRGPVAG